MKSKVIAKVPLTPGLLSALLFPLIPMSLTRRQHRLSALTTFAVLVGALSGSGRAAAEPHCPPNDPNPPPVCGGERPTPKPVPPKPVPPPPPAPVALEPMVFIEVGDACAFGPVGTTAASTLSNLLAGNGHSTCVGPDLRIGAWPSYQSPSDASAVNRLKSMTARQGSETYAVRISERYLKEQFAEVMEDNRAQIEGGGRRLTSYNTDLVTPDLVKSRITVKKTILGLKGRASADITDRTYVSGSDLACDTNTSIDTNAAADIGQAFADFTHFTFNTDAVDIRGQFRSEIATAGTPGCRLAQLIPDYVLLRPIPNAGNLRVNFTPTRAGVLNGNFEVGGTWAQTARNPRVSLSVNNAAAQFSGGGVNIPVKVMPRDLSGNTHLTVKALGAVRGEFDLPGQRGQEPAAKFVTVPVTMLFSEGAKATLTVEARDSDGITATSMVTWKYVEKNPPISCSPASALAAKPGGCQSPPTRPDAPVE